MKQPLAADYHNWDLIAARDYALSRLLMKNWRSMLRTGWRGTVNKYSEQVAAVSARCHSYILHVTTLSTALHEGECTYISWCVSVPKGWRLHQLAPYLFAAAKTAL
jgi:hypothetical protein